MLGEDSQGNAPSEAELLEWADSFGLTHPVLSDGGWAVTSRFLESYSFSLPTMHQLGAGMEILRRDTIISENQVENALP